MKKALIAMSGGVDSSIAAKIMSDRGYLCTGCTMKLYHDNCRHYSIDSIQPVKEETSDAAQIAECLGMPFYIFDFSELFDEKVVLPFISDYIHGKTPNPCVNCNRFLKFGKLLEKADDLQCDILVTGHYARISYNGKEYQLKKALDETKYQSYVLYSLTQEQLSRIAFPLGEISKKEVRAIAENSGFLNANRPDSQDICFIPDGDYAGYIEKKLEKSFSPGDFIDPDGKIIGKHRGIIHYTVGQRRGLGVSADAPLYVRSINPDNNTVTLVKEYGLMVQTVVAGDVNIISGHSLAKPIRAEVKLRYRQFQQPALVRQENDRLVIFFDKPLRAPAPGQAAVIYQGDVVIGGGTIISSN